MNVLVLGAGQVGLGVAHRLKDQGIDVTVIEKSSELVFGIRNSSDINIVHGNALDIEVLKNANAENSTHLIACMSDDERNILACKLAGALFNIGTKIARIRSHLFFYKDTSELFLRDNFEIDLLIHPELEVAKHISNVASVNGALDLIKFGRVIVVCLKCKDNTEILNTTFKHFQSITSLRLFVLTITRNETTFFPSSGDFLLPEDEVYIATVADDLEEVMILFGYSPREQNFLVVGGGNIGSFAVQAISENNSNPRITLLEKSQQRAEIIAQQYPHVTTILGDALNYNFLKDVVSNIDTAIVATGCDETNVLTSLLIKRLKVDRILTLAKSRNYDLLLPTNFGHSIIDPTAIAMDNIMQMAHLRNIVFTVQLRNSLACVVKVNINESCSYLNEKIEFLYEKDATVPVFILRNNEVISARKDERLELNDQVIIIVLKNKIKHFLNKIA
ncbi:MAG: NAD-binding protein [Holosporaceae bacterium]|jgi:trk system potassium uptake protein TrkA|nr:NAD-binding protein [Holosporaceae bacterium]